MAATHQTTDLTQIAATLKEVINDKEIKRQIDYADDLVGKIKSTSDYAVGGVGRKAIVPTRMNTNRNTGARAENQALPKAGTYLDKNAEYNYKNNYFAFHLSGPAIASTSSDIQALTNVIKEAPAEALYGFGIDVARQVYGNNISPTVPGVVCKCGTTSASTTVHLDPRSGHNAISRGHLEVGQYVDVGTAADPDADVAASEITAVNDSLTDPTIVISDAVTTNSSDYITLYDNRVQADGVSQELTSLNQIGYSSGTVGGLSTASYSKWAGSYSGNSGTLRSISTDLLLTALNTARQKGAKPNHVVTSLGVQQKYYNNVFLPGVRFTAATGSQDEGDQTGPTFNGLKVNASIGAPTNQLFILSLDHLAFHVPKGNNPDWIPGTSGILHHVQGYDQYLAQGYWYSELGTNHRAATVLVDDITE